MNSYVEIVSREKPVCGSPARLVCQAICKVISLSCDLL
jgi:hypothetical protein